MRPTPANVSVASVSINDISPVSSATWAGPTAVTGRFGPNALSTSWTFRGPEHTCDGVPA
ncbi:hypothetical protein [Mumia sp. ZJ1417]|uniref:hypothetical protein n=1 Tax=Mumia sp. ZJ1417 TaxID=2708082 RepID=UPI001FBA3368|nr:hypothetical protein [Mumia sp. ZJ1417]